MALLVCGLRMSARLMCCRGGCWRSWRRGWGLGRVGGGDGDGEDEGGPVVVDDNCSVSTVVLLACCCVLIFLTAQVTRPCG